MSEQYGSKPGDPPIWNPSEFALWAQRWPDARDTPPTTVMLQHPTSPFIRFLPFVDAAHESALQETAHEYLVQANRLATLELSAHWLDQLAPGVMGQPIKWLPIRWQSSDNFDAMVSPWVERRRENVLLDRTLILLASERLGNTFIGSGFGIRVVAHVRERRETGEHEVRITGMSASLPFGPYAARGVASEPWMDPESAVRLFGNMTKVKQPLAAALGLPHSVVRYRGMRWAKLDDESRQVELRGIIHDECEKCPGDATPTPYSFVAVGTAPAGEVPSSFKSLKKVALVADAQGDARVFPRDPASQGQAIDIRKRRVTRTEAELDAYRDPERVLTPPNDRLEELPYLRVFRSRFALGLRDRPLGDTRTVPLPGNGPPIRSNDLSAISAYRNLCALFERLEAYGLDPAAYFHIAQLPVRAMYRSGVRPGLGKDGQTVNARVLPVGWKIDFFGPATSDSRPVLEVHLALANLSHRAREKWDPTPTNPTPARSPAEPLGIGADARWVWHEVGHLLLMASVGELELRFAHSPGDALAAIVSDPHSELAKDKRWRFATYPSVFLARRHDRCVLHGWSWGGSLHRALRLLPDDDRDRVKGYWSEQILSSSLFRLYRCIGGDTTNGGTTDPDRFSRDSASHYTVYLIIKAIGLLGNSGALPANHAEQFAQALILADIGTGEFTIDVTDGEGHTKSVTRIGGCVHKVIRWAFEAQGMYAGDPNMDVNAPGLPEPVDVYIEDRRGNIEKLPSCDVTHGRGGYVPVSLDWPSDEVTKVDWHAHDDAITRDNGGIVVTVKNRGNSQAQGVTVQVWRKAWSANASDHDWNQGAGWIPCNPLGGATTTAAVGVQPNGVTFGPFQEPATAGFYLILAQASCADDPANSDPQSLLPCSQQNTPLVDLVANDNNLGLRVIEFP